MDPSIDLLVRRVNADVVQLEGDDFAVPQLALEELTTRILDKTGGSSRLDEGWLPLASMIVSICGIVVKLLPMLRGKPPAAQRQEVIVALEKQTEDKSIGQDTRVRVVVDLAVKNASQWVTVEVKAK